MISPVDKALEQSDEQLSTAIQLFIDHKITLVQAAHLVGLSASEVMDELRSEKFLSWIIQKKSLNNLVAQILELANE